MTLVQRVHTFGQYLLERHGERVHKVALDAGFTCPNRDGSLGTGGCTFCNNQSFNPACAGESGAGVISMLPVSAAPGRIARRRGPPTLAAQFERARTAIGHGTGARRFIAYFQAYTNTYAAIDRLRALYDEALAEPDVIGISVGTRPDCVPPAVLDLLAGYRDAGHEVWLELGLQSAFDATLARVNRGHGFTEYAQAVAAARGRGLPVCTHLIAGLPGEDAGHVHASLDRVLELGVEGLKLHPLHVVRHTILARQWRRGEYVPLSLAGFVTLAADLIERTPWAIPYHRVTATASADLLLAPGWCGAKWRVLNAIEAELRARGTRQGDRAGQPYAGMNGVNDINEEKVRDYGT